MKQSILYLYFSKWINGFIYNSVANTYVYLWLFAEIW